MSPLKLSDYLSLPCHQITREGEADRLVDARDPAHANWMRWVNCARAEEEQNLTAYQVSHLYNKMYICLVFIHIINLYVIG